MIKIDTPIIYGKTNVIRKGNPIAVVLILSILAGSAYLIFEKKIKNHD